MTGLPKGLTPLTSRRPKGCSRNSPKVCRSCRLRELLSQRLNLLQMGHVVIRQPGSHVENVTGFAAGESDPRPFLAAERADPGECCFRGLMEAGDNFLDLHIRVAFALQYAPRRNRRIERCGGLRVKYASHTLQK